MKMAVASLFACCIALALVATSHARHLHDFDHLRLSVVRIQAVASNFDWFTPFSSGQDGVGLGSGFIVQTEPYPLFVTNQHVINDAKQVTLQLLLYGEQQWEADVVAVCSQFDLAVLVLRDPEAFKGAMAERDIKIQALELANGTAAMGEDVVALGFPLGQDALKISKGNIAGNEEVDGNICIQSTAPISPGSSGGPLLDAEGVKVVGVNFAKATEGENINYVIPAWRVHQVVQKHLKDQPKIPEEGKHWQRLPVKVPTPDITTIEANAALYKLSGGCDQGVYVAKVSDRSFLSNARPSIASNSFLVSVTGKELDGFGMGLNENYAADRVSFKDLFLMAPDLSGDVEFETCAQGKVTKHVVSMAWKDEYERGLRYIDEPALSGMGEKYEMFGDLSVMEMTVNHISAVVSTRGDPSPARWLHPDMISTPRLIVNYVRSGSYASDFLSVGAAVKKINGHEVHTLADFKEHFVPEDKEIGVWMLETDMGKVLATMFKESLGDQLSQAEKMNAPYLLTPSIVLAGKTLGFLNNSTSSKTLGMPSTNKTKQQKSALLLAKRSLSEAKAGGNAGAAVSGSGGLGIRASGPLVARRMDATAPVVTRVDAASLMRV